MVVLTWPLARQARTHLPSPNIVARTDALVAGWALAAQSHALVSAPRELGHGNIFHPSPHALFYGPMGTGALPLFLPVFVATKNPTLALNATLLLGLALTAWTMTLVVQRWTGSTEAGLVAAAVLLANSWLTRGMVETAPFAAALFSFPIIIWLAATARSPRDALWLGMLAALQCLVDTIYVAPAVLAPLGVLAVARLVRRATRPAGWCLVGALALAVVLMAPILAGYAAVRAANPDLPTQTFWRTTRMALPLPYGIFADGSSRAVPLFLLAFVAVAGAHDAWRRRREARDGAPSIWAHGSLWMLCGIVISLPPSGLVGGHWVPLPLYFLRMAVPAVGLIRTNDRLGVAALMGAAVLAGAATLSAQRACASSRAATRVRWLPRLVAPGVIAALFVSSQHFDPATWPAPASFKVFPAPRWSEIAANVLRGAHGAVLELPIPPFEEPDTSLLANAMYRSTQYWQPLLNGHHSYYPSDYPARAALAARIPDADALAALRSEAGLAMIAVSLGTMSPAESERWKRIARDPPRGLRLVHQARDELIFEVVGGEPPAA